MLGHMIAYIRKDKKLTKAEIAKDTRIDTGHITHIEKGERNPSHKVLKNLCKSMGIPYRPLMYTYDKKLDEEHLSYNIENHISYNKILSVEKLDDFITCPIEFPGACIAVKMNDTAMEPRIKKGVHTFIEFNSPLNNKDIGLFSYNNELLIRRFIIRQNGIVLRSEDRVKFPDICFEENDNFYIIGKVVGYINENNENIVL